MLVKPVRGPGRPQAITPEKLRGFEEALCWGWSIRNSCDFAGIAQRTFFDYLKRHPEFRSRIELLREKPALSAKRNIAERLEQGDIALSRWFLERRDPEYASTKKIDLRASCGQEDDDAALLARLERLVAVSQERAGR